nr:C2 calcium-dependent membrane targeting [Tanacetum cinerariifolium]
LRRSGRVKCKGPVIKENTIDDAYFIEDDSSRDDFVKMSVCFAVTYDNGKKATKHDSGAAKKRKKSDIIGDDNEKDKKVKREKEKRKSHMFFKQELARKHYTMLWMGFYVVDNFSQHNMEINLNERSIKITQESICEMIGIKNKGVDIMEEEDANNKEMVQNWVDQFEEGKDITPGAVKFSIMKSKVADMNFKLNFIVLFTSVMGSVKLKGICDLSVLNKISRKTELEKINWCKEYEEIKAGGFGNGELQGTFVEKKGDPMPEDEDGFLWELNKYIENIRKERNGFERTFAAADLVFCDNNEEPLEVCMVQIVGDTTSKDYDSPVFTMGQAMQKEVFTMVDKVVDFEMVLSLESPVTDTRTHAPGSTHNIEPIKAVSLSMYKPVLKGKDLGNAHGKRKYTKAQVARSRFRSRVTDINVTESKEEKKVETYLLKKIEDKKLFGIEAKANESVTKFLLNMEKVNERGGRKSIIKQVDLVFIPVSNYGHKFLIFYNTKYPTVNLIDSKNNLTKDGYIKSMVVTNTNDMVVATVLVEVKQENFYWQTDKKTYDSGVFLMRHMEAYMGNVTSKWECGLEVEDKKKNTKLGHLRKRYDVTLLLSECNLHRDSIRAQLNDIEVANVPRKRIKLPRAGK